MLVVFSIMLLVQVVRAGTLTPPCVPNGASGTRVRTGVRTVVLEYVPPW